MLSLGVDPDTHRLAMACVSGPSPFRLVWMWQSRVPDALVGDAAVVETARQIPVPDVATTSLPCSAAVVAIESQAVYPDTPLGVSGINGLLRLAQTAGAALSVLVRSLPDARFLVPTPFEWKGNVPKAAHHQQIREQLDEQSRATLASLPTGAAGHVLDAIGLAIWAQGAGGAAAAVRRDVQRSARERARAISAARRRG